MAIDAATSLLVNAYHFNANSNQVAGLLGSNSAHAAQNSLLSSSFGSISGSTGGAESLASFVQEFVPNNESLLSDIQAVQALANLFSEDSQPTTAAFSNAYTNTLALGHNTGSNSIISELI